MQGILALPLSHIPLSNSYLFRVMPLILLGDGRDWTVGGRNTKVWARQSDRLIFKTQWDCLDFFFFVKVEDVR